MRRRSRTAPAVQGRRFGLDAAPSSAEATLRTGSGSTPVLPGQQDGQRPEEADRRIQASLPVPCPWRRGWRLPGRGERLSRNTQPRMRGQHAPPADKLRLPLLERHELLLDRPKFVHLRLRVLLRLRLTAPSQKRPALHPAHLQGRLSIGAQASAGCRRGPRTFVSVLPDSRRRRRVSAGAGRSRVLPAALPQARAAPQGRKRACPLPRGRPSGPARRELAKPSAFMGGRPR